MRRNYISPEYKSNRVEGTFNMTEEKAILGSKMMDIEDVIILDDRDIIYYQNTINEQINLVNETRLSPIIYSISDDKEAKHKLTIDESQNNFEKQKNTKWIIEIKIRDVLVDYIFAKIKEERTFQGIKNTSTKFNNIDTAIKNYINSNILSRYDLDSITLYIKYNKLKSSGFFRYQNTWNKDIVNNVNIHSKIEVELNFDKTKLIGRFTQEQPATDVNFDYYFNINYSKY